MDDEDGSSDHGEADESASGGRTLSSQRKSTRPNQSKKRRLTICLTNCKYDCVRRVAQRFGLREVGENEEWTLYWTDLSVNLERVMAMKGYQKINHFPGMHEISRKDMLARNMMRLRKQFPDEYKIAPRSWCMPADYADFLEFCRLNKNKTFISKPDNSCQGKGIIVTKNPKDIKSDEDCVVQEYISKPFLVNGFKYDMRLYVLMTSCDPLRIFVYKDGLARFATIPYTPPTASNVSQTFMHLTNYSINKFSASFIRDNEEGGSKRRVTTMNRWFVDNGYDLDKIWADIEDVIIKTIISCHPVLKQNYRSSFPHATSSSPCFEITGFDIILDHNLKPWLIEVNHSPSYHTDAQLDKEIKEGMLTDALRLINMDASDRRKCLQEEKRRVQERLTKSQTTKASQLMSAGTNSNSKLSQVGKEPCKEPCKGSQHNLAMSVIDVSASTDCDDSLTRFEDENSGGFRRIYPQNGNAERYAKFFNQYGSLYTETAAAKARLQCVKSQLDELAAKQRKEEQFRSQLKQAPRDFSKVVKQQRRKTQISSTVPIARAYLPASLYQQKQLFGSDVNSNAEEDMLTNENIAKAEQDALDADSPNTVTMTTTQPQNEGTILGLFKQHHVDGSQPQSGGRQQPTCYHDGTATRPSHLYHYANPPSQPCLQSTAGRLLRRPTMDSHTQLNPRPFWKGMPGSKSQTDNATATMATLLAARTSLFMQQSLPTKSQPLLPRHGLFKQGISGSLQVCQQARNASNEQQLPLDGSPFLAISGTSAAISSKPVAVDRLPQARTRRMFPRRVPPIAATHGLLYPTV